MNVNDKTVQALSAALKFRTMRQKVITANIANAETPGYKAKRLEFEQALSRALDHEDQRQMFANDPKHQNIAARSIAELEPDIINAPNDVVSDDGNTVDPEDEMARMVENKALFDANVELLRKKLGMMDYALNEK